MKIALGIDNVKLTTTIDKILGTKCLEIILVALAPIVLAEITNSCSFKRITSPRTKRAIPTHPTATNAVMIVIVPLGNTIINKITINKYGIPLIISTIRIITLSIVPPK